MFRKIQRVAMRPSDQRSPPCQATPPTPSFSWPPWGSFPLNSGSEGLLRNLTLAPPVLNTQQDGTPCGTSSAHSPGTKVTNSSSSTWTRTTPRATSSRPSTTSAELSIPPASWCAWSAPSVSERRRLTSPPRSG